MNKIRTPQSVSSIEATLKRFDKEEADLKEELRDYSKKWYKLHLKRAQAMGRLKKAQRIAQ